ncbi:hypothetical protein Hdeb2414_s0005g00184111 [Helianthus debilis subsp. tardiflorus]
MILVLSYMFTGVDIQWILTSLLISNYKARWMSRVPDEDQVSSKN